MQESAIPVPTRITDFVVTAASNSPGGTESIGTSLDDYLRAIQAVVRADLADKGADIASAATTDLGAVAGRYHDITGVTTITAFGTVDEGVTKTLKFEGALTLTHNATSLILPGGANIATANGDIGEFVSEGSGNWRCNYYFKAATGAVVTAASDTASGIIELAVQAEMETATDVVRAVTPGRQQFHPGHPKAWGFITMSGGVPTLTANYNITSIADTAVGTVTVTIATDFSSANYAVTLGIERTGTAVADPAIASKAAGSFVLLIYDSTTALVDAYDAVHFSCFGDQ